MSALLLAAAATAAAVAPSATNRTVMLWVFRHDNDTAQWNGLVDQLTEHRANVTHIAMCTHRLLDNGTFGYQSAADAATGQIMEHWAAKIAKLGFTMTPLIDALQANWQVKLQFLQNDAKVEQFIADAVAVAERNGYHGYNMDIELNVPDKAFGIAYAKFLNKFADALHAKKMTLSNSIAGYCPPWFNGAECSQYQATRVDRLYTMNTYQEGADKFRSYIAKSKEYFGFPKFAVGMSNSQDPKNMHDTGLMDYAVQQGVRDLAVWVLTTPYPASATTWDDMGYFLHYAH